MNHISQILKQSVAAVKRRSFGLFTGAALLLSATAGAQTYQTIAVTGYNADVIANGPVFAGSVTADVDGGGGFYFLNQTFTALGTPVAFLPTSGLVNSAATAGLSFQMAPATASNSLRFTTNTSATLNLVTPQAAGTLYLMATSGSGASVMNVSINFTDNISQVFNNLSVADWFGGTPVVVQGFGRTSATALENPANNPRLYQVTLPLAGANLTKNISSITVTRVSGGVLNVMGVSAAMPCAAPAAQPTGLSLNAVGAGQVNGSFTAAAADQYLVVRYPAGSTPTTPVSGTTYTTGATLGAGTVVSSGAATTFSATSLAGNTSYDFYVYAFNSTNCVGPVYQVASPLQGSQATTACAGASGTVTVGPSGTYPTLTAAFSGIASGISGSVVFELQSDYSSAAETFPITIGYNACVNATRTVTIRPAAGATGLNITGSNAGPTVDLTNARYVTIDGRPGGTGTVADLKIINTNASGMALRFINDAQNNTITYCDLQGQNNTTAANPTTTQAGVVYFGAAHATAGQGNDNNTISFCRIHGTTGGTPVFGILASTAGVIPASDAAYNDNNLITGNLVYDVFSASTSFNYIKLDVGSNAWTISNNHFYQTAVRTVTAGATHRAIWITTNTNSTTTGNGFVVTGNFIGGTAASAGGSALTINGAFATVFFGMDLSVSLATPTSVQGNTITNFNITTNATGSPSGFMGISQNQGSMNIGTVTGNEIGSGTATGAITVTTTAATTGQAVYGIRITGGTTPVVNIANNTIGGITTIGSGTVSLGITGIHIAAGTTVNISNNLVGSLATANSLNASSATTGLQSVIGINVASTATQNSIGVTNNTIANLNNNYTGTGSGLTIGINLAATGSPVITALSGNTIRNLSSSSASLSAGNTAPVIGINMQNTNVAGVAVTGNTIHSLSVSTATAAANVVGLFFNGTSSSVSAISRNFIHSFDVTSANTATTFTGIDHSNGTVNVVNNMIRLGIRPAGTPVTNEVTIRGISSNSSTAANNFYHNTIYIGGTVAGTTARNTIVFNRSASGGNFDIRNNIFVNLRSNATTGGKHYIYSFTTNTAGNIIDYNIYQSAGTGAVFANNGAADVASYTTGWVGTDTHGIVGDPSLVAPAAAATAVDLHVATGTLAEGAGTPIASVTDDFDGGTRASLSPVDIGADAGNFAVTGVDVGVNGLIAPASVGCFGATQTVTVRLKNFSSNAINFATTPVIVTVNIPSGTGSPYSSSITLSTGSLTAGATQNVTVPATLDMSAAGSYTFNATATVTGDVNTANNSMTPETRTVVTGATLSGNYNVGAGQGATGGFETLTAAIAAYNTAACISGNVVFQLTSASYSTAETFPLVINANPNAGSFTLTIRPAAGNAAIISGTTGTALTGLIRLNGADNIIIDGVNTGGASLTIENTATTSGATVIWLQSAGFGSGATSNMIRNLTIKGGVSQNTATTTSYGVVISGTTLSGTITSVTAGDDNDNNIIESNTFLKLRYAVFTRGGSAFNMNSGTIIRNNLVGPAAFGPDEIGKGGIIVREEDGVQITGNEVRFVGGDYSNTSSGTDRAGIVLGTDANWTPTATVSVKNALVSENKVHDIIEERTFSSVGILVATADGATATNNTIANNMIWNVKANGTGGDQGVGIGMSHGTGNRIVYNTVYLAGDTDPNASATTVTGSAYGIMLSATTVVNPEVRNNNVFMDVTSSSAPTLKNAAIFVPASFNWGMGGSNHNNFYIETANAQSNIGSVGGTFVTTLAGWQAAVVQDAASVSVKPVFTSATDLHLVGGLNFGLNNVGTPVSGITTDIDGDVRSTTPDIGADEFTPPAGVDIAAGHLVTPIVKNCYSAAEAVSISIRSVSANTVNFAVTPVTVTVNVTGAVTATFTTVLNSGTLAAGDSMIVVLPGTLNMSAAGTYTFSATAATPADANTANNSLSAVRTVVAPAGGTITVNNASFCLSGTPTLTLAGQAGGSIQWQESASATGPWTNVGTGTTTYTPSAAITANTYYQVVVSCNVASATSNALQVSVNNPLITGTTPGSRCGPGSVVLSAAGTGATSFNWYTSATGGVPVATGTNFITPVLNATTTYYVSASAGGTTSSVGVSPTATNCGNIASSTATDWPLRFNTTAPVTLNSAYVIPSAAGTFVVALRNALSGADIQTATFNFTAAQVGVPQQITLGWAIPASGSYQLTNTTGGGYRISTFGCTYPFTSALGGFSVVGSATTSTSATNTTTYNIFFQLNVSEGCESARQAVVATVNAGPAFDVTNNLSVCNNSIQQLQVVTPAANYDSYVWTPAAGLFTDAAATVPYTGGSASVVYVKNATAGTYTYIVNASNTATNCSGIDSVKVTVLPATVTLNATAGQLCNSGSVTLSLSPTSVYSNATFQWQSSTNGTTYNDITGATAETYNTGVINTTTYYRVVIRNSAGAVCQQPFRMITVQTPSVVNSAPASICGPGTVTLGATGSAGATLSWYTTASGGTPVATGGSFTTPSLSATTTYYVSATSGGSVSSLGPVGPTAPGLGGIATSAVLTNGVLFDVYNTASGINIQSVDIFPTSAVGTPFTIVVRQGPSATGTILASYSGVTTVTGTTAAPVAQTVPVNFALPAGSDYVMTWSVAPVSIRNTTVTGFPFSIPGEISINNGTPTATWNYFYNWRLGTGCESPRVAVAATVNTVTAISTQPLGQNICAGSTLTLSVAAAGSNLSYQWFLGTAPITGATSATYTVTNAQPIHSGSYSVRVTGACGTLTSNTVTVTVNGTNSWLGVVSSDWANPANWCGGLPTATTDVLIPASAPNQPVINGVAQVRNITIATGASLTNSAAAMFDVYGDLTVNGNYNAGAGFIFFRGAAAQSVSAFTAANVVLNGAGGVVLSGPVSINTLVLQNGNITLGVHNLTVSASVTGSVNSHVITNGTGAMISNNIGATPVIVPVGPDANNYNPVMITNGQGRNYTVKVVTGITPALADNNKAVNRTWNVTPSAAVTAPVSLTFQYANSHGNAQFNPAGPNEIGFHTGTSWKISTPSFGVMPVGGPTERQVTLNTTTEFGNFVVTSPGGITYITSAPVVSTDITGMVLMPNAVQSNTVLRIVSRRAMKMNFIVVDAAGRVVQRFPATIVAGTNQLPLDFSRLKAGMYFISGRTDKGEEEVVRFVKL